MFVYAHFFLDLSESWRLYAKNLLTQRLQRLAPAPLCLFGPCLRRSPRDITTQAEHHRPKLKSTTEPVLEPHHKTGHHSFGEPNLTMTKARGLYPWFWMRKQIGCLIMTATTSIRKISDHFFMMPTLCLPLPLLLEVYFFTNHVTTSIFSYQLHFHS